MRFDMDLLDDHVCRDFFSDKTELVSVRFYNGRDNVNALQDKVLHIRILSCTLGKVNAGFFYVKTNSLYGNKKAKTGQSQTYDRCFLVADLTNPPYCAMILTRNSHDSALLLKYTKGDVFIGTDYYIKEPNLYTQTIGDIMPILSLHPSNASLFPLKYRDSSFPDTENKMEFPTASGETNYFILKKKPIQISRASLVTETSCTGIQCDRQKGKGECTCMHNTTSTSFVYALDVTFKVPSNIDNECGMATVQNFQSLRTTSLFFKKFEEHAGSITIDEERRHQQTFRQRITSMVKHINDNGGWTIVGWFKLGEAMDAAATDSRDKVENYDTMTMHISYLMPTNETEAVRNNATFKLLQIQNTPIPTSIVPNSSNTTTL